MAWKVMERKYSKLGKKGSQIKYLKKGVDALNRAFSALFRIA
jgi:hypothetical protein